MALAVYALSKNDTLILKDINQVKRDYSRSFRFLVYAFVSVSKQHA